MSFAALLVHEIAVERPYQTVVDDTPVLDDYGQPVSEYVSVTEEIQGLIQPKSVREIPLTSDAGAMVGLHTAFFAIDADLTNADRLYLIETGEVYQVKGIRPFRFGTVPHFEVDCDLITSIVTPEEVGS